MRTLWRPSAHRVTTRLCLACGYDGPELQGEAYQEVVACPRCGEDLYQRPARTYAEMEGLPAPRHAAAPRRGWWRRQWSLWRQWVALWTAVVRTSPRASCAPPRPARRGR